MAVVPAFTSRTVVSALIAVPPMPTPKIPTARPRRSGGNHALTNGTPTANAVPPMPRKNPPISRAASESCAPRPMKSTGTTVASETSGNMIRPPNRSVSAPTGMRPSEPTTTGTATSRACWKELRSSAAWNLTASGLSSAHAQKFTANPMVASASISPRRAPVDVSPPGRAALATVSLMVNSTVRCPAAGRALPVQRRWR